MTTLTPVQRDQADAAYRDHARFIQATCRRYQSRYGGPLDDYLSQANEAFCRAYATFDPDRAEFITWLGHKLRSALLDLARKNAKQTIKDSVPRDALRSKPEPTGWWVGLLESVTDDAATVLRLCVETPREMLEIVMARGGNPQNLRSTVKDHLRKDGWSTDRLNGAFDEVKEVLEQ